MSALGLSLNAGKELEKQQSYLNAVKCSEMQWNDENTKFELTVCMQRRLKPLCTLSVGGIYLSINSYRYSRKYNLLCNVILPVFFCALWPFLVLSHTSYKWVIPHDHYKFCTPIILVPSCSKIADADLVSEMSADVVPVMQCFIAWQIQHWTTSAEISETKSSSS